MKTFFHHKGVEFYVFRRDNEFIPVVLNLHHGFFPTLGQAEQAGRDVIDSGIPLHFTSTITWPDGSATIRKVDLSSPTRLNQFHVMMYKSLARGASITIQQSQE